MINYQLEKDLDFQEFKTVLIASSLGERRPVEDSEKLKQMLKGASIIITARDEGKLVGVARSISDFAYCTYLSDLAVSLDYQKKGIGKALIKHTQLAAPETKLILLSAPKAVGYYPKIGMQRHENCFYTNSLIQ